MLRPIEGTGREYEYRRLAVLGDLVGGRLQAVCVPDEGLTQYTTPRAEFCANTRTLHPGDTLPRAELTALLYGAGYARRDQVDGPGQFSIRGDIVDIYAPDMKQPARLEFWPTTNNTSSCSAIAYGQNALTGSEKLSFYISNYTTSKQPITVTPRMYALRDLDGLRVDLWCGEPLEMKRGDSTESTPYTVTSWEADLPVGQYTIYAETTDELGVYSKKLSTLSVVSDKPWCSVMQTFRGDGRCAVILACSGPEGSLPFGVEYRKDGQEEANRVSSNLYLNKGYITSFCISFESDASAKYSFRAFCEADDGTSYTDWCECPAPAAQLYYFFGDSQRFRLRNLKWQAPHDCGAGSSLQENIDTKTPYPWDGVGEISLSLFLKFRSVVIIHERQKKLLQHIRCKVFSHYWSQNSIFVENLSHSNLCS